MTLSDLTLLAAESSEHGDPAINPYVVGLITFAILMSMLIGLLAFGAGREHS